MKQEAVNAIIKLLTSVIIFAVVWGGVNLFTSLSVRYCTVDSCPSEAASGSKYCYGHKCDNTNCKNRAVLYGYCEKCLERAN